MLSNQEDVFFMALRGINKTAWGAKLILTADLAYPGSLSCASLGQVAYIRSFETLVHYRSLKPSTPL